MRLPKDCRDAASALAHTDQFETGQGILHESAAMIESARREGAEAMRAATLNAVTGCDRVSEVGPAIRAIKLEEVTK